MKNKGITAQIPVYKMVRESIINDIVRGVYEAGSTIPPQNVYAEQFGVSRATVRKAIEELVANGVLVTTKYKGTVVADYKLSRKMVERTLSFNESKRLKSATGASSPVVEIKQIEAKPWIAKQLSAPVGSPVIFIKRVRLVKGRPENFQISYLSASLFGGLEAEDIHPVIETGSLFRLVFERSGRKAGSQEEEVRAVHCPDDVAPYLGLEPGDPVLLIIRSVNDEHGDPLEYCEDYENTNYKGLKIKTYSK